MHSCMWHSLRLAPTITVIISNLLMRYYTQSTPSRKEKIYRNEWMNEMPQKCTCMPNVLVLFPKPERAYWSLTPQLDTVVLEVSLVKMLRLSEGYGDYIGPTICHHERGPMVTQDFTVAKLAILTWRYFYAKNQKIRSLFKPLITWVVIKNVDTSVTTQTSSWLAVLEPWIKAKVLLEAGIHVGCWQARSISYNFW